MKYLFIIGKSGSGKTTLAKNIENAKDKKFKRIIQFTSREMRDEEIDGQEYFFVTKNEFNARSKQGQFFAEVRKQFAPSCYGTPYSELDSKKTNIVVCSIEGFLDCLTKFNSCKGISILNIIDVEAPEAKREGRESSYEEVYNEIVLKKLLETKAFNKVNYFEIRHEKLKKIRNNPKELLRFLKENKVK